MKLDRPLAMISDFDGTISKEDFFWYAIDKYLKNTELKSWQDYKTGKIPHVKGLSGVFELIRAEKEDFNEFILQLPIEDKFVDTLKLCKSKDIPFYVVSAGSEYYINLIMKNLQVENMLEIYSNKATYSKEQGLKFAAPDPANEFYSSEYGVSKQNFMKKKKDEGYFCIFAGDGNSDFAAAELADVVFARGVLLQRCRENGVKTLPFDSYGDVFDYISLL